MRIVNTKSAVKRINLIEILIVVLTAGQTLVLNQMKISTTSLSQKSGKKVKKTVGKQFNLKLPKLHPKFQQILYFKLQKLHQFRGASL